MKPFIAAAALLFLISPAGPAFAQGAASGESITAYAEGTAPLTPGTVTPGLSYADLAGTVSGAVPGRAYNAYGAYGPYGQYAMYGPYGTYGPPGPGFGSGPGFNGFGMHDPW